MSKRNPTSELNHDNWDQEDEKEDAGRFKTASQEVLKARQIRVAKRRAQDGEDKGTGGLFKSFTGFTGFGASSATAANASGAAPNSLAFNFSATATPSGTASATTTTAKSATPAADPNATHLAKLKALNQSVLRWIQSHVTDSPYCVLTPVFRDYERHLADIESRHPYVETANSSAAAVTPTTNSTTPAATPAAATAAAATSPPKFSFSAATSSAESSSTSATSTAAATATTLTPSMPPTFSFSTQQQKPSTDGAATTATFFFGASAKSTTASSTSTSTTTTSTTAATTASSAAAPSFTFGAGPALPQQPGLSLFGPGGFAAATAASSSSQQDQENEEYEPPKPETREIREDGAVFSQKCKLFYMAAGEAKQWKEKGVGCVHVKPAEGGSRAQLIVRADNTLGTIMLNTLVTKDMTLSVAKNNLSLACPPNPPMPKSAGDDRRIVPFLVRLKAEADAKELLAKINGLREA